MQEYRYDAQKHPYLLFDNPLEWYYCPDIETVGFDCIQAVLDNHGVDAAKVINIYVMSYSHLIPSGLGMVSGISRSQCTGQSPAHFVDVVVCGWSKCAQQKWA